MEENKIELQNEQVEQVEQPLQEEAQAAAQNLSDKNLAELSDFFQELRTSADAMMRSKEAEAVKSAFYKLLLKMREAVPEGAENPFEAVEENFKAMYADYKKELSGSNKHKPVFKAELSSGLPEELLTQGIEQLSKRLRVRRTVRGITSAAVFIGTVALLLKEFIYNKNIYNIKIIYI